MGKYRRLIERIWELPDEARAAVAVCAAQRLMDHHRALPRADRDTAIEALSSDLDKLWEALSSPRIETNAALVRLMRKRNSEPYAGQIGRSGEPRGDDHTFAAAANALQAYCLHDARQASGAAMRLIDAASDMARAESEAAGEDLMSPGAEARREDFAAPEFDRVTAAVRLMEREGVTLGSLIKLRKLFAGSALGRRRARGADKSQITHSRGVGMAPPGKSRR